MSRTIGENNGKAELCSVFTELFERFVLRSLVNTVQLLCTTIYKTAICVMTNPE